MVTIKVFYVWGTDDEGGYGVCKKDKFTTYKNGEHREVIFEFSSREEFIEQFKNHAHEIYDYIDIESEADFYCNDDS